MIRRRVITGFAMSVLAALLVAVTGCSGTVTTTGGGDRVQETVDVTILARGVLPEVSDTFEVGQIVRVRDTATVVGEIIDIEVGPAITPIPTFEGELEAAESPVFDDVRLTIRGEAVVDDAGYSFGGRYLYINDDIKYLTPFTIFSGLITSVEVAED